MKLAVKKVLGVSTVSLMFAGVFGTAQADTIPYQSAGTYNDTAYTFAATTAGDVMAYWVGGDGASNTNLLGLLINGVLSSAGYGLGNHSSLIGESFDLGVVNVGDSLIFVMQTAGSGDVYSDPSMNAFPDGSFGYNRIYSTAYTATSPLYTGVPMGTYIGFEDLPSGNSDYNYNDESFVFKVVPTRSAVPEPGSLALVGLALAGVALKRRKAV